MNEPVAEGPGEAQRLRARIDALEAETKRAFEDAQREADTLFAQYQLSQLLASGGSTTQLGDAVVVELARLAGAAAAAIWVGDAGRSAIGLVAVTGVIDDDPPASFDDVDAARAWARDRTDVSVVVLGEESPSTVLALRRGALDLDADGLRIAQLARHEVAVAFGGARLRETLERERSELGAVVDGATDVIVQVDGERLVTRLNPAGERVLGIAGRGAVGRSCADVLGCAAAGGHEVEACPFAEVLATGRPIDYRETAIRGATGAVVRVAGGYSPSPGGGSGLRATGILRDISAIRALEELREGFVATVSHELRTPLALVRGYAETVLLLDLEPAEQHAYLERIHQVSARLTDLVSQILDVTHLDADPLILERAPASFAALVARLRGDLVLSGDDARLVADLPPDLPPIEVDAARVGRILENLVGNALKYAPDGTPVVVGAADADGWLTVSVDDDGIGIPESERALVTEPFHRAWNVRESRIPGTGLGLYICRRLVEAHGGRLWVGDRPDGRSGTRVTFTLPLLSGGRQRPAGRAEAVAGG
jgi:signal transduction histidine kinase